MQDTVPDYSGSGLAGVAQGADGGNPMSNAYSGAVRLSDGIVNYATTDFSVPGTGFARTVSRIWTDQPGLVVNPSFGNGEIMTQLPYLIQATGSIIAVIDGQPYYFDQVSANVYQERFFGLEQLTFKSANDQYQFVDTTGTRIVFNGFAIAERRQPAQGMYRAGRHAVGDRRRRQHDHRDQVRFPGQHDPGDRENINQPAGRRLFTYAYHVGGQQRRAAQQRHPGRNGHTIAQAQYTYYAADDPNGNGNDGDLEQVRVWTSAATAAPSSEVDGSYYHYCGGVAPADDLEDAVTGLAYARLVADRFGAKRRIGAARPTASTTLGYPADISDYADGFEYDDQNRVAWQAIVGTGASSLQDQSAIGDISLAGSAVGVTIIPTTTAGAGVGINAWNQKTTIDFGAEASTTIKRSTRITPANRCSPRSRRARISWTPYSTA